MQFVELEKIILAFGTELLRKGYSKKFAYDSIYRTFKDEHSSFEQPFNWLNEFAKKTPTEYVIVFKVYSPKFLAPDWPEIAGWQIAETYQPPESIKRNYVRNWLKQVPNQLFIERKQKAMDHISAVAEAVAALGDTLDLIRLAKQDIPVELNHQAVTFPEKTPSLGGLTRIKQQHDGLLIDKADRIKALQRKMTATLSNPEVGDNTKEKLRSAIRYLRFGMESKEIGQQFLNYWIGLEYLFARSAGSTFTRIIEILPDLQTLAYFRRNLTDFHHSLVRAGGKTTIKQFEEANLQCLLDNDCLKSIRDDVYENKPLLSYRAWKLRNRVLAKKDDKGMQVYHTRHRQNIAWHLARIYRVRNQIVHEASYRTINPTLTSNLRYYLSFVLSLSLDYFSEEELEAVSIEELFALLQLRLKSIELDKYQTEQLLDFKLGEELLG